ncbi:MAG TPA: ATP-binding protein, partial [Candidatus Evtepia faecigallinarum]|nr:ATP-binding protein [Candidatus Evtepia faecigallinarum]
MKLLKIRASGIPLFQEHCEIDFLALQRVTEDNAKEMSCVFHTGLQEFYQNNVLSVIGINASGKTTILKLIAFVCRMLNNEPLNGIDCADILDGLSEGSHATLDTYFFARNRETFPWSERGAVNLLRTVITKQGGKLAIARETLQSKALSKVKSKKALFDFDGIEINLSRNIHGNAEFLLDDVSIMVAFNKRNREQITFSELLRYTNINHLRIKEDCPSQLIAFFDPSIEYLKVEPKTKGMDIRLKFKGQDELLLKQMSELDRYLSSGTIKGINVFLQAMETFQTGGYLIVDELENHFNREIVATLIR